MVEITNKNSRPIDFIFNRFLRIFPIYFITTLLAALAHPDLRRIILSLLFIPHKNAEGVLMPILGVGWTLNYEMFFYILFSASIFISAKYRSEITLAALFLIALTAVPFYGSAIIVQFALGIIIAKIKLKGTMNPWLLITTITFSSLAMILGDHLINRENDWERVLAYGIPAGFILLAALSTEKRLPKLNLLHQIGDASYSIYLVHMFPMAAILSTISLIGLGNIISSLPLLAILALSFIGIIFGVLFSKFIELPIHRKIRSAIKFN